MGVFFHSWYFLRLCVVADLSDKAIVKINSMNSDELKEYLISLVKESMTFGIEIINGGE